MSAHVLLELLNELGKRDKMRGLSVAGPTVAQLEVFFSSDCES